MEKLEFPVDIGPDILNHWTTGLTGNQIQEEIRRTECWPSTAVTADTFDPVSEEDSKAIRDAVLKDLELREQKKRSSQARRGSVNGRTKLDEWDVCLIRSMNRIWGLSVRQISERRGLPRETVRDIVKRRTWTHV